MKFAVCFSGSIRDYPTCLPSIKRHLLSNLDADVFLDLWQVENVSELNLTGNFKWKNDKCTSQYVIETINPVKYSVSSYDSKWESDILTDCGINMDIITDVSDKQYAINACGMYYKIFKCNELVKSYSQETGVTYDIIIRARLDFIWTDSIISSDFSDENDVLYLLKDRYAAKSKLVTNDKFFCGNPKVMDRMCDIIHYISEYQSMDIKIEGQSLHEFHIKQMGFSVKWIGNPITQYKCMRRHKIIPNKTTFVIYNQKNDELFFDFAYHVMYRNYHVNYVNCHNDSYNDILESFPNFSYMSVNQNPETITYNKTFYLSRSLDKDSSNDKILIFALNKITTFSYTKNITVSNVVDFIFSICRNYHFDIARNYEFNDKYLVKDIPPGTMIEYRDLDHGNYIAVILSYDTKIKKYKILSNNQQKMVNRDTFRIINIINFVNINSTQMPVNFI